MIAAGRMLGPDQPVELHLLDIPPAARAMEGVAMELQDCAFPLLRGVVATTDVKRACEGVDVAVLVGAFPRRKGMERADLLEKNAPIFKEQGLALARYASRDVKICVVGNPANTNALIALTCAEGLPAENFTAMTRLDHNRALGQLSERLKLQPGQDVRNVIIWGNHSSTQYPDVNHALVSNFPAPGFTSAVRTAVGDDAWLDNSFVPLVQKRGAAIIEARKLSSAASAANAAVEHVRDWLLGTRPGHTVSMGVISDGSYGVPKGVIYSFPVTCANGKWQIVQGLHIDAASRRLMDITGRELLEEKKTAFRGLGIGQK
eukprot:CAMPEP_0119125206 /NCGR_PEP_ID=MMETSP1310-20130426/4561_1 /TAXON_ID=464262 /ORGANISM="Genus nov. species nov., Strain RCC2339" /LENGTH=317 /DNA_ID=CAMNT_0007115253 /DNA_START=1 /DNA_END=954 /DNA_ORIENTATION=+